jgi:hypothetical protein
MSMHLVGPYLTTTRYGRKSKKTKSVKAAAATEVHDKWLRDRGLHPEQRALQNAYRGKHRNSIPDYRSDRSGLSDSVGNGFVKGVMANLHKESPEVQRAIMEKAARTTMAYNKGPTMYFSPESDTTNLGSRSRRG